MVSIGTRLSKIQLFRFFENDAVFGDMLVIAGPIGIFGGNSLFFDIIRIHPFDNMFGKCFFPRTVILGFTRDRGLFALTGYVTLDPRLRGG